MYIIINKTKNTNEAVKGNWPSAYIEEQLEQGDKLIVISQYSNTIKVPSFDLDADEWVWEEYSLASHICEL